MPLFFSFLPQTMQKEAIKKMDFLDFVKFRKCSKYSNEFSSALNVKLSLSMDELYIEKPSKNYPIPSFPVRCIWRGENDRRRKFFLSQLRENINVLRVSTEDLKDYEYDQLTEALGPLIIKTAILDCDLEGDTFSMLSLDRLVKKFPETRKLEIDAGGAEIVDYEYLPSISQVTKLHIEDLKKMDVLYTFPHKWMKVDLDEEKITPESLNLYLKRSYARRITFIIDEDLFPSETDALLFKDLLYRRIWTRIDKCRDYVNRAYTCTNFKYAFVVFRKYRKIHIFVEAKSAKRHLGSYYKNWEVIPKIDFSFPSQR